MTIKDAKLHCVAVNPSQYPADQIPEIAFAGKSNVGKSSLINTMMSRKRLARTSGQPGKTRTINFYDISLPSESGEDHLFFVDLPGYGYAKASKIEIEKWGKMVERYLMKRENLFGIIMLIDIRHEPSENDVLMYNWLTFYQYDMIIVATKLDKIKKSQVKRHSDRIKNVLGLKEQDIFITFSSETKQGRDQLWQAIEDKKWKDNRQTILWQGRII